MLLVLSSIALSSNHLFSIHMFMVKQTSLMTNLNEFSFITSDLTFYFEKAESWKELIERTTRHTGRMRALPEWIQEGAIVGLMGGKESVSKRLKNIKAAGTPLAGVWLQDWVGQRQTQIGQDLSGIGNLMRNFILI